MDVVEVEREMAWLDAVYRPVATRSIDPRVLDALTDVGAVIESELAGLGVGDQAEATLHAVIGLYRAGDETVRAAIRRLFDRYTSFRWATALPRDWDTAEEFRDRLVHLSARDQDADARDEILTLQDLCSRARQAGIDVDPILEEVAAMSSDVDRTGGARCAASSLVMGSLVPTECSPSGQAPARGHRHVGTARGDRLPDPSYRVRPEVVVGEPEVVQARAAHR